MQRPFPVDLARQNHGTYLYIVTAPQPLGPLGPMVQGLLMTEIRGVDLIRSQAPWAIAMCRWTTIPLWTIPQRDYQPSGLIISGKNPLDDRRVRPEDWPNRTEHPWPGRHYGCEAQWHPEEDPGRPDECHWPGGEALRGDRGEGWQLEQRHAGHPPSGEGHLRADAPGGGEHGREDSSTARRMRPDVQGMLGQAWGHGTGHHLHEGTLEWPPAAGLALQGRSDHHRCPE